MTKIEIETKLKEMRAESEGFIPGLMKNLSIDGKNVMWNEFKDEEKRLKKMYLEIMKNENGWYWLTPVKDVLVENGKVVLGVCRGFDGPNLMLVYKTVKQSWDDERTNYSGKTIQSDEWGIYERVREGATPDEIAAGKYLLREVYDNGSCHDLEEIYAELCKSEDEKNG